MRRRLERKRQPCDLLRRFISLRICKARGFFGPGCSWQLSFSPGVPQKTNVWRFRSELFSFCSYPERSGLVFMSGAFGPDSLQAAANGVRKVLKKLRWALGRTVS